MNNHENSQSIIDPSLSEIKSLCENIREVIRLSNVESLKNLFNMGGVKAIDQFQILGLEMLLNEIVNDDIQISEMTYRIRKNSEDWEAIANLTKLSVERKGKYEKLNKLFNKVLETL